MMKAALLKDLISAVYTPFDSQGRIKTSIIPSYTDYLVACGMSGLYICGSTGEGVSLSVAERKEIGSAFVEATADRIPTVIQVGANSLADCVELAAHAESIQTTAISANAPSYFQIKDTTSLVSWLTEIAAAAPTRPFYYYHIPVFTGVELNMTEFLAAMEEKCPQFRGVKYSDIKGFVFQEALSYKNGKYEVLWGCDEMLLAGLAFGGLGGVGSTFAMAPALYRGILTAWNEGDLPEARRLQRLSWEFVKILLRYSPIHPSGRLVMKFHGLDLGTCRLPFAALDPSVEQKLHSDLEKIGFFEWSGITS